MKKEDIYIHKKTGNEYSIISYKSRIKFDGKWFDAVIYEPTNTINPYDCFVRKVEDFNEKFILKID
tara:strand:+ start:483 stop:680 length:198 start_codon:yes stop_codon:yes gene_type:complete